MLRTHTIPIQVYGGSVRPRTYTILEVVGCTPGGTLSSTVPLEATLKVGAGGEGECVRRGATV
jgi:hypothetical protein